MPAAAAPLALSDLLPVCLALLAVAVAASLLLLSQRGAAAGGSPSSVARAPVHRPRRRAAPRERMQAGGGGGGGGPAEPEVPKSPEEMAQLRALMSKARECASAGEDESEERCAPRRRRSAVHCMGGLNLHVAVRGCCRVQGAMSALGALTEVLRRTRGGEAGVLKALQARPGGFLLSLSRLFLLSIGSSSSPLSCTPPAANHCRRGAAS